MSLSVSLTTMNPTIKVKLKIDKVELTHNITVKFKKENTNIQLRKKERANVNEV